MRRILAAYAQPLAGLAAAFGSQFAGSGDPAAAWQAPLAAAYRQAFWPAGLATGAPAAGAAKAGADWARWTRAGERLAALTTAIANDACARLARALADDSPDAPPVTTLAGLQALWVECGDAAWLEAAHREEFAEAQAEYLSAVAALRAAGPA